MNKINTDSNKIDEILNRGTIVETLPTTKEFREKLLSGEKLKFYIGFDATAPTLHLSHAKNFMLMEKFRKLGHEVIILFGDFTARIGDPTGENSARKQLSREDVVQNVKKWKKLIEPLMDFKDKKNSPKIMYNNDWLAKLTLEDVINLASNFTVQQMLERDMFQKRLKEKKPIHLHEFLYPLMQGYDSVAMDVDVEMCGTDQTFNALAGRTLLKKLKGKDKFVVAVTLMENPKTGELMSKSKGTGVFLDTSANDMFGQIMAQPDEMIEILFVNNTFLSLEEIKKSVSSDNPRDTKAKLAREIVAIYHGEKEAKEAEKEFNKIFRDKKKPSDIESYKLQNKSYKLVNLLVKIKLADSMGNARRLVQQGGVRIDDVVQNDFEKKIKIKNGMIVQVGKRRFVKIKN
ncbi:MAG: tyrosine--tRNA ligase [Candidatus Andersenbacteria bacterium]|nr:tyrosine--tRNA ligase [Candidatus Andersenbacteria bacterium]